jgi:uncharacterized protein YuzE
MALVQYDPEVDALYFVLRSVEPGGVQGTRQLDERRLVHLDQDGEPVGVEILFATEGIDLDGLPEADQIRLALLSLPQLPVPA